MGILGEDSITCVDEKLGECSRKREAFAGLDSKRYKFGFCFVVTATALLVTMCVALLVSEAAQHMAAWTFHGDHRAGAVVGLVLCTLVPTGLFVWERHRRRDLQRLIAEFPPADTECD